MQSTISRRAVLAGAPAVAAVAALPAIPALSAQDPHPKWWAERQAWRRTMSAITKEMGRRQAALPAEFGSAKPTISRDYEYGKLAEYCAKMKAHVVRRDAAYERSGITRLDAEYDRARDRVWPIENLILETESHTIAGLAIQLRMLEITVEARSGEADPKVIGGIADSAERLSGGAA